MTLVAIGIGLLVLAVLVLAVVLLRAAGRLELELEAVRLGRADLTGRHVVVNTRRPDDQSIRGVVREQFDDGGILLGGAAMLQTDGREIPTGDYYVAGAAVSGVQVDAPVPAPPAER